MNRTLPLILTAALLLTACASAAPAQIPKIIYITNNSTYSRI